MTPSHGWGGDEFCILLENCNLSHAKPSIVDSLTKIMNYKFYFKGQKTSVAASAGVVEMRSSDSSYKNLLKKADFACYAAKRTGKGIVVG